MSEVLNKHYEFDLLLFNSKHISKYNMMTGKIQKAFSKKTKYDEKMDTCLLKFTEERIYNFIQKNISKCCCTPW